MTAKSVLVTGGAGYIGSILCRELLDRGHWVTCVDRFYFGRETVAPLTATARFTAIQDDSRRIGRDLLAQHEIVIDLASLSNDPTCDLAPEHTERINYEAPARLARLARDAGVRRFLFASSCSVYGAGSDTPVRENDPCHPVSLYAACKLKAEAALQPLAGPDFTVSFLRNATANGASPRMRFDLIINIMTMYAHRKGKIIVLGGGRQWRPIIHARDICRAFEVMMAAPAEVINGQAFNIGDDRQNYRVMQIARMIEREIPGTTVEIAPDDPDKRSYRVCFEKAASQLGFHARIMPEEGIREILAGLRAGELDADDIRTSTAKYYRFLLDADRTLSAIKINDQVF